MFAAIILRLGKLQSHYDTSIEVSIDRVLFTVSVNIKGYQNIFIMTTTTTTAIFLLPVLFMVQALVRQTNESNFFFSNEQKKKTKKMKRKKVGITPTGSHLDQYLICQRLFTIYHKNLEYLGGRVTNSIITIFGIFESFLKKIRLLIKFY